MDVSAETNVGRTPKSGMNAAFGDVFNDGRLSIYKTNISEPGVLVQANDLWVPKKGRWGRWGRRGGRGRCGQARSSSSRISPRASASISAAGAGARSSAISTTTGTLDLYLVNGYVSAGERTSYWYDFAQIAVGHSAIIGDAAELARR